MNNFKRKLKSFFCKHDWDIMVHHKFDEPKMGSDGKMKMELTSMICKKCNKFRAI